MIILYHLKPKFEDFKTIITDIKRDYGYHINKDIEEGFVHYRIKKPTKCFILMNYVC